MTGIEHLEGSAYDDTLVGGAGANVLNGGSGTDLASYATSPAGVDVRLGPGTGRGGDASGDTLTGIENLEGSRGRDLLEGDSGANEIHGGMGSDTLLGREGNDFIDGGSGTDLASYATSSAGVDVRLGAGTAAGGDATGDTLTGIENLEGGAFADRLDGDGGANRISGGRARIRFAALWATTCSSAAPAGTT